MAILLRIYVPIRHHTSSKRGLTPKIPLEWLDGVMAIGRQGSHWREKLSPAAWSKTCMCSQIASPSLISSHAAFSVKRNLRYLPLTKDPESCASPVWNHRLHEPKTQDLDRGASLCLFGMARRARIGDPISRRRAQRRACMLQCNILVCRCHVKEGPTHTSPHRSAQLSSVGPVRESKAMLEVKRIDTGCRVSSCII